MKRTIILLGAVSVAGVCLVGGGDARASSHREAPFITKSPKVDSTDFYMFRSYETGRGAYVTLIANYQPFQEPGGGPNYFTLDPEAIYEIHIENTGDAVEDLTFQFKFQNELAGGDGIALNVGGKDVAIPLINAGPISTTDKSALNVIETYSIKMITGARRKGKQVDIADTAGAKTFTKPVDYIGTKSLGSPATYEKYARSHIHDIKIPGCASNGKVFVGQRQESFAVNLGTIFDLVNAPAAVITDAKFRNAVPNPISKYNITTVALELPIACVKGSGNVIGGWQTASVRQARVINPQADYSKPTREGGAWAQVSRLGMPLVNEVVIGLKDKDRWNVSEPKDDSQFADYVTNPTLPALIEILFGPAVKAPTKFPRTDLVAAFLTGVSGVNADGATAEYQRLNIAIPVTAKASQNNLGAAACFVAGELKLANPGCDPAGFPNGRRPGDDVVDIELRVSMGYLLPKADAPSGTVPFHDAVLQDASQFDAIFPYLKAPTPGAGG